MVGPHHGSIMRSYHDRDRDRGPSFETCSNMYALTLVNNRDKKAEVTRNRNEQSVV